MTTTLVARAAGMGAFLITLAAVGAPTAVAAAPVTAGLTGCSPAPLPGLCVGRAATAQEEVQMIAVGKPGIEDELGLVDASNCAGSVTCFQVGSPSRAMVGFNAGTFYGISTTGSGLPVAGCYLFLHRDSGGWHYDNGRCITAVEQIPSAVDQVYVDGGCVNVRDAPSLSGHAMYCLTPGTKVYVDSAPTYATGHIWWHLMCIGWMAHDFLVVPLGEVNHPAGIPTNYQCPSPGPPYVPMVSLSLDAGTRDSSVVVVGSGFPQAATFYYWASQYPAVLGTPGKTPDAQGHFEFDTQDHGAGNEIGFYLPQFDDRICAELESQSPDKLKACAEYKVLGTTVTPSAAPSTPRATPASTPVASVVTPLPEIQVGVGALGVILIGASGVFWWRRRRRY